MILVILMVVVVVAIGTVLLVHELIQESKFDTEMRAKFNENSSEIDLTWYEKK